MRTLGPQMPPPPLQHFPASTHMPLDSPMPPLEGDDDDERMYYISIGKYTQICYIYY